jgi:hypothetical protein
MAIVGPGSTPGCGEQPQWSNGRATMMFSPRDRRGRLGQAAVGIKEGRMLGGTTYPVTIMSRPDLLCRPSKRFCWRMRAGVHGQAGPLHRCWPMRVGQELLPMFVASFETPAANAGGTTF